MAKCSFAVFKFHPGIRHNETTQQKAHLRSTLGRALLSSLGLFLSLLLLISFADPAWSVQICMVGPPSASGSASSISSSIQCPAKRGACNCSCCTKHLHIHPGRDPIRHPAKSQVKCICGSSPSLALKSPATLRPLANVPILGILCPFALEPCLAPKRPTTRISEISAGRAPPGLKTSPNLRGPPLG